jgi:hypothetical protein
MDMSWRLPQDKDDLWLFVKDTRQDEVATFTSG